MNCPSCQRDNPANAQFCIYCAERLVPAADAAQPATGPTVRLGPSPEPTPGYTMPATSGVPLAPEAAGMSTMTRRKSSHVHGGLTGALWLFGIGALALTGWWWPGIMLLVGASMALNEIQRGRPRQALSGLIFGLGFVVLAATGWWWPGVFFLISLMWLVNPKGWHC